MRFWHKFSTKFKVNLRQFQALNFTQILNAKAKFSKNLRLNLSEIRVLNSTQILNAKAKFSENSRLNLNEIRALNSTQIFGVKIKFSKNLCLNLNEIHTKFKEFLRKLCENFGLNKIFGLNLKTPKFSENLRLNLNEIFGLNSAINSINLSPAKLYFYALCEISLLSKCGKIGREVER